MSQPNLKSQSGVLTRGIGKLAPPLLALFLCALPLTTFALSISGTLLEEGSGQPVQDEIVVELLNDVGESVDGVLVLGGAGSYALSGLTPGSYYLQFHGSDNYQGELYDDVPCGDSCDYAEGTMIELVDSDIMINVHLSLMRNVSGTVTSAASGLPIRGGDAYLIDADRNVAGSSRIWNGTYHIFAPAGSYKLYFRAGGEKDWNHTDELYDDVPCDNLTCDPATAVLIDTFPSDVVANASLTRVPWEFCNPTFFANTPNRTFVQEALDFKDDIYVAERGIFRWAGSSGWQAVFPNNLFTGGLASSGTRLVASGYDNQGIVYSDDGTVWNTSSYAGYAPHHLLWTGSEFLAVSFETFSSSPDGITWESHYIAPSNFWSVAVNGGVNPVTVVGGVRGIFHSTDQIAWTKVETGSIAMESFRAVIWTGSKFLAVGLRDDNQFDGMRDGEFVAYTSADGMNWNQSAAPSHPSPDLNNIDFHQGGTDISQLPNGNIVVQLWAEGALISYDDGLTFSLFKFPGSAIFRVHSELALSSPLQFCPIFNSSFEE